MNLLHRIFLLREAGRVERCHCIAHQGGYSVAYHTCQMMLLAEVLHPVPELLRRPILLHDLAERHCGDTPYSAKLLMPDLKESLKRAEKQVERLMGIKPRRLSEEEKRWMKALDTIEFLLWCYDQQALGVDMKVKIKETWTTIDRMGLEIPGRCREFLAQLREHGWQRTPDLIDMEDR